MKNTLLLILVILAGSVEAQDSEPLRSLFEEVEQVNEKYNPWSQSRNRGEEYLYITPEQLGARANELRLLVDKLERMDSGTLSRQDQISREIMLLSIKDDLSEVKFKSYLLPFNAEGGFYNRAANAMNRRRFRSGGDYESYIKWLSSMVAYLEFNQELLKQGIRENIMRPKVIVQNAIDMTATIAETSYEENPFAQPFLNISENIEKGERTRLAEEGRKAVEGVVMPAYRELLAFLRDEYYEAAPEVEGISNSTKGKEFYEDRIRFFTTQDMTPDSVFNLGMYEVNRIRSLMEQVIEQVEFEGSFAEFIEFLRTDPRFYPKTAEELLNKAAWLSKKAEGQLPRLFAHLYELPFTVEPVPDAIAPTYTGGRYVPGSREGDRAGIYWVNTYDLPSRPFYTLPALTLHEAVPGHHLNMMVAAELEGLPAFRNRYYISAFGEGWGLYSEYLGEEMGMYETPYDLFGRYTYEMWRACRLVVDVGLHYKGWNRQEAVDFLAGNTALSMHEVNTEINRYIGWPGQAVSYKVGEITMKSLRKQAEESLGEKFDIKQFHYLILKNGSVPLPILREEIETYIKDTLRSE